MRLFLLFILFHSYCGALTLEEKVGQLLIVHFNGKEANEEARVLIEELHVGGFIYYNWSNGLDDPEQVAKLSKGLQSLAKIPLWIMVDQEGGPVKRLRDGFFEMPGNREIANKAEPGFAYECARRMGEEMRAVGINMNLAPVVDITSDSSNAILKNRTFGHNIYEVIFFATELLQGYADAKIIPVLKHFPGYGNVEADPHSSLSINPHDRDWLDEIDLRPFRELGPIAPAIMTAHIRVPALDPDHSATLSKKILTDLLREEYGYQGLVISDSMVMQGLLDDCLDVEEAAIRAVNAGCDLLIYGGRRLNGPEGEAEFRLSVLRSVHTALVEAIRSGKISETRIDESIQRILSAKQIGQL